MDDEDAPDGPATGPNPQMCREVTEPSACVTLCHARVRRPPGGGAQPEVLGVSEAGEHWGGPGGAGDHVSQGG